MNTLEIIFTFLTFYIQIGIHNCLQNVPGMVGGGNYTYFQLNFEGALVLKLETIDGDADLYISDKIQRPTFELEEHTLSSWTCGLDSVFIPKTMARPIYIAVYGHPRFEISTFIMTADMLPKSVIDIDSYVNLEEEEKTPSKASFKYKTDADDSHAEYKEFESVISTGLYWLLEILIDILTLL